MTTLAAPLVAGIYASGFRPTYFVASLLPLVFALLYRTRAFKSRFAYAIVLIIMLIFLPFFHPWGVLSSGILITSFLFMSLVFEKRTASYTTPLFIIITTWLTWFMTFRLFGQTVNRLFYTFTEAVGPEKSLDYYADLIKRTALPLSKVISIVFFTYGGIFLYLVIAGIFAIIVWYDRVFRRKVIPIYSLVASVLILGFCFLAALSVVRNMITQNPLRLLIIAAVFVPPFLGISLSNYLQQRKFWGQTSLMITAYICLVTSTVLCVFNLYLSPLVGQANQQFSYSQRAGYRFYFNHASNEWNAYSPFAGASTLFSAINYTDYDFNTRDVNLLVQPAPAHFGYGGDYLDITFERPSYLWVNSHERGYYTDVWPDKGRFTPADFKQLDNDRSWQRIYTSGEMVIWGSDDP
jgi:hypothetical protein